MININRLTQEFNDISKFGALENGGITRLAYSKDILNARAYITERMESLGMQITVDPVGNLRGRLPGTDNALPPVVIGSHLDSVPEGGPYDGTIGVMVGFECIRAIKESGAAHNRSMDLVIFPCEESSRFGMATVGSKAMSGKLTLDEIKSLTDKDDISIYDAAKTCGFDPDNIAQSKLSKGDIYAYIELHIEQGPVLDAENISVGIVTGIAAPIRYQLNIQGRADHSGATPMHMRKDALTCASEIILGIEDIALHKAGDATVATVGLVTAKPGVLNVIPGEVNMGIGIRDIMKEDLQKADTLIRHLISDVTAKRGLTFTLSPISADDPVVLSKPLINKFEEEAIKLQIDTIQLPSGAGHDAMHMVKVADMTGMIFVPCEDGISHNVLEKASMNDVEKAANLIAHTMLRLANE